MKILVLGETGTLAGRRRCICRMPGTRWPWSPPERRRSRSADVPEIEAMTGRARPWRVLARPRQWLRQESHPASVRDRGELLTFPNEEWRLTTTACLTAGTSCPRGAGCVWRARPLNSASLPRTLLRSSSGFSSRRWRSCYTTGCWLASCRPSWWTEDSLRSAHGLQTCRHARCGPPITVRSRRPEQPGRGPQWSAHRTVRLRAAAQVRQWPDHAAHRAELTAGALATRRAHRS
jgi:hypothetical protein